MNRSHRLISALGTAALVVCSGLGPAQAAPLNIANNPLFLDGSVAPNILFLIDNSGSMSNIVPDTPFDPNVTYFNCPPTETLAPTQRVDVHVTAGGTPWFDWNGTDYDWGTAAGTGLTGRAIRCFDPAASYQAALYADSGGSGSDKTYGGGYLAAQYTGNYLNWYFGDGLATNAWGTNARKKPSQERRMEIAQTAAKGLVSTLVNVRSGLASYNGGNGAVINEVVEDLNGAKKTAMFNAIDALSPSGSTPLAESLTDIGRYFVQGFNAPLTLHPGQVNQTTANAYDVFDRSDARHASVTANNSPIQYFCQKNFAVLLTDGRPQSDQGVDSNTHLRDYDGDCVGASPACLTYDRKPAQVYESAGSDHLDDVALALFEVDLRPDLNDFQGAPVLNNVITYTVGFADDQVINDPLMQDTANNGNGLFLAASNAVQLQQEFANIATDIFGRVSSAASVALNTGSLSANSKLYQALFDSSNWSGEIKAFPIVQIGLSPGSIGTTPDWQASVQLDAQSPNTGRNILTTQPSSGNGVSFRWNSLDPAEQALLQAGGPVSEGQARLDYVRGSRANETPNGLNFRKRGSVLGDIVSSDPVFVGAPAFFYKQRTGFAEGASNDAFVSNKSTRTPMIYVGANDGMLHGFDATTGNERLAYVPSVVIPNLPLLTNSGYTHRFFVDGGATVGDAFGSFPACGGSPCWRTILVGGLRAGGQGMFALDVTDPASFSEGNASNIALWEFTDRDTNPGSAANSNFDADLGLTYSQASIVRMANGKWAAIFGNGYNATVADGSASATGRAVLYVVDLVTGNLIRKLETPQGLAQDPTLTNSPNGLSTPAAVDMDGNHVIDAIYAGDLYGNMWKFKVDNANPSQWAVAFKTGPTYIPLFTACAGPCAAPPTNDRQPITTRPEVGRHPVYTGVMVYFGTGKYFETIDGNPANQARTQTFYGIWDRLQGPTQLQTFTRAHLLQQNILEEDSVPFDTDGDGTPDDSFDLRLTTDNQLTWEDPSGGLPTGSPPSTHLGWYLDLVNLQVMGGGASYGATPAQHKGERQVTNSVLRNGRIIFTTLLPNDTPCGFGGEGWLMEMDAADGSRLDVSPFDLNGDGVFNIDDAGFDTDSDGTRETAASGKKSKVGIIPTPGILSDSTTSCKGCKQREFKYTAGSSGKVEKTVEDSGSAGLGRQSWQELY